MGLHLSQEQLKQFHVYYQEMVEWNERVNLTTITAYEDVQIKHFLDSLTATLAWQQPKDLSGFRFIDVGSGAGLPGIPLKIAFPDIKLVLLEATARKAAFLQHMKQRLGLDDIEVSAFCNPPLTTVRQSFTELATLGVKLLLDILADKEPVQTKIMIQPDLIVRGSTSTPREAQ